MNAHTRFQTDPVARGPAIVATAKRFDRHPYVAAPDRGKCFDCVALINMLSGADVPENWMRDGGRLPFDVIDPPDARPGDLVTFCMPWPQNPHHVAILTRGEGVDDPCAQVFGPWFGHATATCWLRGWRPYVTGAYRMATA